MSELNNESVYNAELLNVYPVADEIDRQESVNTHLEKESWIRRHKTALGLSGFAIAGAISLTQSGDVRDDLAEAGKWVAPVAAATESVAWVGGSMMMYAAGRKIGNPLTIKPRLKEVAHELVGNKYYKRGWITAAVGATGTASVISIGAVSSLPKESWPLAFTIAGASLGFSSLSLPYKSKNPEKDVN